MTDGSSSEGEQVLKITFERLFCARHGEPFRYEWPKGFPTAMMMLVQAVMELEETQKDGREIAGVPDGVDLDILILEKVLDKKPACCRLPPKQMLQIYLDIHKQAGLGKVSRCQVCKLQKLGTPYRTRHESKKHVCFSCVLFAMKPFN